MKIGNRINMTITNARMSRIAKTRAFTSGVRSYGGASGSGGLSELLKNLNKKDDTSYIGRLLENQEQTYNYTVMKQSAGRVKDHMDALSAMGESSIFGQEDTEKAKEQAISQIDGFVDDYNIMMNRLKESEDAADSAYAKKLKDCVSANSAALKELGITANSDGTLKLNEKVLKESDLDSMKKVFGAGGSFGEKISALAKQVGDTAARQITELKNKSYQLSSNYTRYGTDSSSYGTDGSGFNIRG